MSFSGSFFQVYGFFEKSAPTELLYVVRFRGILCFFTFSTVTDRRRTDTAQTPQRQLGPKPRPLLAQERRHSVQGNGLRCVPVLPPLLQYETMCSYPYKYVMIHSLNVNLHMFIHPYILNIINIMDIGCKSVQQI